MAIGDNIKQFREARNITQLELARRVGYKTRSTLSRIEHNDTAPTQKNLIKIAEVLGVTPAELQAGIVPDISQNRAALIRFAQSIPESKVDVILPLMQSFLEDAKTESESDRQSGKE